MSKKYGERLIIPEWENQAQYRSTNGWKGHDLIHSPTTSNVHLIDSYYVKYDNNINTNSNISHSNDHNNPNNHHYPDMGRMTVTGYVHFTQQAESHAGYCHGGAACSIMDDIIGWTAFCCGAAATTKTPDSTSRPPEMTSSRNDDDDTDNKKNDNDKDTKEHHHNNARCIPWSGYTVQINTKLCKPIPVDSYLYVQGIITNIVRRKVYVTATLYDTVVRTDQNEEEEVEEEEEEHRIVYATCEGIVVMNPGVLPNH